MFSITLTASSFALPLFVLLMFLSSFSISMIHQWWIRNKSNSMTSTIVYIVLEIILIVLAIIIAPMLTS